MAAGGPNTTKRLCCDGAQGREFSKGLGGLFGVSQVRLLLSGLCGRPASIYLPPIRLGGLGKALVYVWGRWRDVCGRGAVGVGCG